MNVNAINYYSIRRYGKVYFICPTCQCACLTDFLTFCKRHQHLVAFTKSKKSILLEFLAGNVVHDTLTIASTSSLNPQIQRSYVSGNAGSANKRIHMSSVAGPANKRIRMSSVADSIVICLSDDDDSNIIDMVGGAINNVDCPLVESHLNGSHVNLIWDVSLLGMITISVSDCLRDQFKERMNAMGLCKVQFGVDVEFEKDGMIKSAVFSNNAQIYETDFIECSIDRVNKKMEDYTEKGSDWKIFRIMKIFFKITKYSDIMRLSGSSFIETPLCLKSKRAIVNVHNGDNLCFMYSILAITKYDIISPSHRNRLCNYYEYLPTFEYNERDFPMKLSGIRKFEVANKIAVNVLSWDETVVITDEKKDIVKHPFVNIIYKTKMVDMPIVNLLLLEENGVFHYTAIVDIDRLLNSKVLNATQIRSIWCHRCLHGFKCQKTLDRHRELCLKNLEGTTMYMMPKEKYVKFSDYSKTITYPYTIYADFESLLVSDDKYHQKHMPASAGFLLVAFDGRTEYHQFEGENCIIQFLEQINVLCNTVLLPLYETFSHTQMIALTDEQEAQFTASVSCYLCNKNKSILVRDHCHFTGQYIGPACKGCNLARRISKTLQVQIIFHNLKGYDMHHILKHGINHFKSWSLSPIPNSTEKFLALIVHMPNITLRFLDSYQFLSESLATLSGLLVEKPLTASVFDTSIINTKSVFPYDMATSFENLEAIKEMPAKWSDDINQTDYESACRIWTEHHCSNLKEYMLLYMKLDVYLLADVVQAFRVKAKEDDGLDALNFFGLPGFAWATALKGLKHEVELIQDPEMHKFFEGGIRGGMTFVNKHQVVASSDTSILYIDINNLYGWALSQKLPYGDFKWIHDDMDLLSILEDCEMLQLDQLDYGYICEVDIEIPASIHDKLDDLPIAPEHGCPPGSRIPKLLLTHKKKYNYVVNWRLLQMFLKLGAKVTRIIRAVSFKQDNIFAAYISKNTAKRALACNDFEKNFYKLMNNALYGKTVENLKKRLCLRLVQTEKALLTYVSKPAFNKSWVIADNLVSLTMRREMVVLDRPSYIGQAVLDLSKLRMYQLQYHDLEKYRQQFNCTIGIVAGDTDSFFLECKNVDLESQLLPAMIADSMLDTSNYPRDHPLYDTSIKKVIGKFTDESEGISKYTEGIFLRPKCYYLCSNRESVMKAKGVNIKNTGITYSSYRDSYDNYKVISAPQTRFISKNHQIFTDKFNKVALSSIDNKRRWLERNKSVAYGHYLDI